MITARRLISGDLEQIRLRITVRFRAPLPKPAIPSKKFVQASCARGVREHAGTKDTGESVAGGRWWGSRCGEKRYFGLSVFRKIHPTTNHHPLSTSHRPWQPTTGRRPLPCCPDPRFPLLSSLYRRSIAPALCGARLRTLARLACCSEGRALANAFSRTGRASCRCRGTSPNTANALSAERIAACGRLADLQGIIPCNPAGP